MDDDLLVPTTRPLPSPGPDQIAIAVSVCGVCHTELDEIHGRTPPPSLPVIPGHQAVGRVVARGARARRFQVGDRVGVGWIWSACGECRWCRSARENLCPEFKATGRDADGGYAERLVVPERFACPIPEALPDESAAPLLCAGAIGWRSLRLAGLEPGQRLGLTGFGASGHLVLRFAKALLPGSPIVVFARSAEQRAFAMELGADWAGDTTDAPPEPLDAIIDTTPAWTPVLRALEALAPGGRLVVNAIRKESRDREVLATIDYPEHLWMEKEIKSAANVTRSDIAECLEVAARTGIAPAVESYPLAEA
ncbi:MAG: alcohol dehydrogenase catalytic domain-containing protein, partial [Gemmatimonadales bacterium]